MLAICIIAGIILFILIVLSIAVDMAFDLEVHEDVKWMMRVGWLFGLVWKDIDQRKKRPEKKEKKSLKPFLSVLKSKGLPGGLLKLARQILRRLKFKQLDADLRVGLDDPADTGMMCSVLWPALIPPNAFSPTRFRIEPVFDEPAFEGNLHGRIRLFPIQMVRPILYFALSPTGRHTLKSMVVSRWKQKQ